jgi:transposase
MPQNFIACDRDQQLLLPPSLREWLPEDHLAWFVLEAVAELDLDAFYGSYRRDGWGAAAHDPQMMVALFVYAYSIGVRSARGIERRCRDDVAFRVITGNQVPDHATIARFRVRHEDAIADLFGGVLELCAKAGLVSVGIVAVDGTKIAAAATHHATRSYGQIAREILEEAAEIDAAEDELYGELRGDELPEELADPHTRAGRIRQLLDDLQAERDRAQAEQEAKRAAYEQHLARTGRRRKGRPPKRELPGEQQALLARKVNVTDPDSAIVSDRGKLIQGYNLQLAVAEGQLILAAGASGVANDHGQLAPLVAAARERLAAIGIHDSIEQVLADSGYWNVSHVSRLHDDGLDVLVQPRPWRPDSLRKSREPVARQMTQRLTSRQGAARYRRRQQIVEPVFAHIKHLRGITRLLRRGRAAAQAEIDLIATTHNLLKLYRQTPDAA